MNGNKETTVPLGDNRAIAVSELPVLSFLIGYSRLDFAFVTTTFR